MNEIAAILGLIYAIGMLIAILFFYRVTKPDEEEPIGYEAGKKPDNMG